MPRTRGESWDISGPLRELLKQKGWSQKRLGLESGINRTDINRFVAKKNPLKVGRVRAQRLADALRVTVLDLGLPPDDNDAELQSFAGRLQDLQADVAFLLEWVGRGFDALGVPPALRDEARLASADGDPP